MNIKILDEYRHLSRYRFLRKTKGIQRMVKIATDQDKLYSPRVVKIANQVSVKFSNVTAIFVRRKIILKLSQKFLDNKFLNNEAADPLKGATSLRSYSTCP